MPKKRKLPFWLVVVLVMVLAALLVLLAIAPQPEQTAHQPRMQLPPSHRMAHQPASVTAPETADKIMKAVPPPLPITLPPSKPTANHGLALILDDVGYNIRALRRILALSVPVAISVLPDAPHAVQSARLAHQAGQVVMLHLPMQPEDPSLKMSDAFLLENMSKDELRNTFLHDLAQVPYVEGVNNHMGSKLTQLESAMHQVMMQCKEKGLFFVDSRTSSHSVAARMAANAGLKWASRQIFLDHIMTPEAMAAAWNHARACVQKGHRCIIIAHPRAQSVAFLESHLTKEDAAQMVSIKRLLRRSPVKSQQSERVNVTQAQ